MPFSLSHKQTRVYAASLDFLEECYRLTDSLPFHEQFNLQKQIRRAALSTILNIAEGSSRFTATERKRFYEIARSSVVEVDTGFTVALRLNYYSDDQLLPLDSKMSLCFNMLTKMISYQNRQSKTKLS